MTAKETPQSALWRSVKEGLGVMAGLAARRGRACARRLEELAVETAPTGDVVVEEFVGAVLTAKKTPPSALWRSVKEGLGFI